MKYPDCCQPDKTRGFGPWWLFPFLSAFTSPVPKYVECSYFRSDLGQLIRVCIGAWRCGFASVLSSNAAALCSGWLDKLWNSTCAGNVEVIF